MMAAAPEGKVFEDTLSLEDRLRGLILNNARPVAEVEQINPHLSPSYLPPHMISASDTEKEDYIKKQSLQAPSSTSSQTGQSARGGRKRPNQAQRRQMNSQISLPFDTRPTPQGSHSNSPYVSSSGSPFRTSHYGRQGQVHAQSNYYPPNLENASQGFGYSPRTRTHHHLPPSTAIQSHMHPLTGRGDYQMYSNTNLSAPASGYRPYVAEHFRPQMPHTFGERPAPRYTQLYQTSHYNNRGRGTLNEFTPEQVAFQVAHLEALIAENVPKITIGDEEVLLNEDFRASIETVCRAAIDHYERTDLHNSKFNPVSVNLKCFGSMASGFATKASDMDLALFTPDSNPAADSPTSPIPRLIEKELLNLGYGARLLTRTRVPIIKLCQKPPIKLMSDLLEEREKWENGFADENEEDQEEAVDFKEPDKGTTAKLYDGDIEGDVSTPAKAAYEDLLLSLKQKPKQSLGDYYGSAKRLLRNLGARDVSSGYAPVMSSDEVRILGDVCRAFLNGLSDEVLKSRLSKYQILSLPVHDQDTRLRSLSGIHAQIEGEQLAMSAERRPLHESTEKAEADFTRQLERWHSLLNRTDVETLPYNRMLYQAVEALKKVPSLQLLFLEQGLREDPLQYHARTFRIMNELIAKDKAAYADADRAHAVAVTHYVAGIRKSKIRDALQNMASQDPMISLNSLLTKHRIMELADDYETALRKNLYDEIDRKDIEKFTDHLRNDTFGHFAQPSNPGIAQPLNVDESMNLLIEKLRHLPDPGLVTHKIRNKYKDHLEFPKTDIGVQCDINFSAHLGIHNTQLLRCYSLTDARVKPLVLFIKSWAKARAINTPYRGTLSSYGYVLMVLHYLTNIATPFVCPNLQVLRCEPSSYLSPAEIEKQMTCNGYDVAFWHDEKEIASLADCGELNRNRDPLGKLLRGFFEYFANSGPISSGGRGFDWGRDVLSLRSVGGLLTKQEKGWVGARTVIETTTQVSPAPSSGPGPVAKSSAVDDAAPEIKSTTVRKHAIKQETKEIKYRYLFAIEDPFEIDHNVARTVTHDGIIAIRDELRRAWQIIKKLGTPKEDEEALLDPVLKQDLPKNGFQELMDLLYVKVDDKTTTETRIVPEMQAA